MFLSPVEERLMAKLDVQSLKGSRQNKIISLLMNNNEYNLRVQNIIHSDKLNSLVDNEYFMSMYYNSLYEKIDKLLGKNEEDFGYVTQPSRNIDSEIEENEFVEDEMFDSDENTTTPRKDRRGGISIKSYTKKETSLNFQRKTPIQKNNKSGTHTPSKFKKRFLDTPSNDIDNDEEKRLYDETKALLDEEIDGFDEDEFEAELPRRINEAMEVLTERLKGLKTDEFGDPIIEDGYLEEPQGKNLQLSALRLANLMSMMFKKNPIPEFNEHIRKLLKNFSPHEDPDLSDMKAQIMSGKGIQGILGVLQKNMQKTSNITDSIASKYPTGFNPSRRASNAVKSEQSDKVSVSNKNLTNNELINQNKEKKFAEVAKKELLKIIDKNLADKGEFHY